MQLKLFQGAIPLQRGPQTALQSSRNISRLCWEPRWNCTCVHTTAMGPIHRTSLYCTAWHLNVHDGHRPEDEMFLNPYPPYIEASWIIRIIVVGDDSAWRVRGRFLGVRRMATLLTGFSCTRLIRMKQASHSTAYCLAKYAGARARTPALARMYTSNVHALRPCQPTHAHMTELILQNMKNR
jgi:hypothetical protein